MIYIVGEVFSRAEGYLALKNLIGAIVFHTVFMFVGGFFFLQSGTKPAPQAEKESTPSQI